MKGSTVTTFSISEPHEGALRTVRRALAQEGLSTPAELNVAARIKKELGAGVAPCVVLYVDDPALLLEAVVFDRSASLMMPQPVVVSGNHRSTEVLVHSAESLAGRGTPASLRDPLLDLQRRILRALDKVAVREEAHMIAT
jgi:uncharacterized protein (DUF302 family)